MDIDNGGPDGKPVIIVLPKFLRAAKTIYDDFRTLTSSSASKSTASSNPTSLPSTTSSRNPAYEAQMAEFLAATNISDSESDPDDDATPSLTPSTSCPYLTAPTPTHRTRRSPLKPDGRRRRGRSYADAVAATTAVTPAPDPTQPILASRKSSSRTAARSTTPPPPPT
jgi:hypothetical protein